MDVWKARMNRFTAGLLAGVTAFVLLLPCAARIQAQAAEPDAAWGLEYDSATEFFLRDAGDLYRFAQMVNEGKNFADKTVTMADDIQLGGVEWTPIGTDSCPFSGVFDGAYHTVTGLSVSTFSGSAGFFGLVRGGEIRDLTVEGSVGGASAGYAAGVVASLESGAISGCENRAPVNGTAAQVGGVVGLLQNSSATDCKNTGDVSGSSLAGGVIASVTGNDSRVRTVSCCINEGSVTATFDVSGVAGGVIGSFDYNSLTVANCENTGDVQAPDAAGGVVGRCIGIHVTVSACQNTGSVTGGDCTGGVIGGLTTHAQVSSSLTCADCRNTGTVTATPDLADVPEFATNRRLRAGGILGDAGSAENQLQITGCENHGNVQLAPGTVLSFTGGGILSSLGENVTVSRSSNSGAVLAKDLDLSADDKFYCGGIAGYGNGTIENCSNTGNLTAPTAQSVAGGILGEISPSTRLFACYSSGSVSAQQAGDIATGDSGTTEKVYYLAAGSDVGPGEAKSEEEFASGEVAWLLQDGQATQIWGQALPDMSVPMLTDAAEQRVFRVSFEAGESGLESLPASAYTNRTVKAPVVAETRPGKTLGWFRDGARWNFETDTVTKDMTLTAAWYDRLCAVTVTANDAACGTVAGGGDYLPGTLVTVTATPADGYSFSSWKFDADALRFEPPASPSDAAFSFVPQRDVTLTADFKKTDAYRLETSVTPADAGFVEVSPASEAPDGSYPWDTSLTLTAHANNGYLFDHWECIYILEYYKERNPVTLSLQNDIAVQAVFFPVPEASVSGTEGKDGWYRGDVALTPPEGYKISADGKTWSDTLPVSGEGTLSVPYCLKSIEKGTFTEMPPLTLHVDNTPPALRANSGLKDGGVYCLTLTGSFDDEALDRITVNDVEMQLGYQGDGFTMTSGSLNAPKYGELTIKVYDKAGNCLTLKATLRAEHDYTEEIEHVEPDCLTRGHIRYQCSVCKANGKKATKYVDLGYGDHSWGTPSWDWAEDGSRATARFTCERDESHTQDVEAAVTQTVQTPAGCETAGTATCTATATLNGTDYTATLQRDLPATGHTPGETRTVIDTEPDCTNPGAEHDETVCAVCGAVYTQSESRVLPAHGHSLEKTEARPATETQDGNCEYWTCSVCGGLFADAEGKTTLSPEEIVRKAYGSQPTSPQTGEHTHYGLWIALLLLSTGMLAVLFFTRRLCAKK